MQRSFGFVRSMMTRTNGIVSSSRSSFLFKPSTNQTKIQASTTTITEFQQQKRFIVRDDYKPLPSIFHPEIFVDTREVVQIFPAEKRTVSGSNQMKKLRNSNKVPGVIKRLDGSIMMIQMELKFLKSIMDREAGLVDRYFDLWFDNDTVKMFVVGVEADLNPHNLEPYHFKFRELVETPDLDLKREDRLRKFSHWERHLKSKQQQQQQSSTTTNSNSTQ